MPVLGILEQLGRLEEIVSQLYPYRFIITPILIAAALGVVFLAYRRGVHVFLLRHRLATTVVGVPALTLMLFTGYYMLSPLWQRSHLDEASPLVVAESGAPMASETAPAGSGGAAAFEARVLLAGEVMGADAFHFGRGDAVLVQTGPDSYVLRFENFSVRNGPDLFVYLSEDPSGKMVSEPLNLGALKATDGAFNYEVPATVDVSKVRSAVVWCRQFAVLFAHAELVVR